MKKKLAMLMLLAISLSFAACSGKDSSGTSSTETQKDDTKPETDEGKEETASSENSDLYFSFLDDGTTVSGLTEEGNKQKNLVIPEQAQSLMGLVISDSAAEEVSFAADHDVALESAFTNAEKVKKVTLPAELTVIPYMAFGSCTGLESIEIPAGVTKIDEYAFDYCTNLKEVTFAGTKCEVIGEYAFELCGLEEITLPEGLKTIEDQAFFDCDNLSSVTLPSTIESIGAHAFNDKKLSEAHFAADTKDVKIDPTAFGVRTSEMTVYITEGSWMDQNRDKWNVGFGTIAYE